MGGLLTPQTQQWVHLEKLVAANLNNDASFDYLNVLKLNGTVSHAATCSPIIIATFSSSG